MNERTLIFAVADLEIASVPNQLFTFTPPLNAALVKDFDSDPLMVRLHGLVGKPAPMVELGSGDGPTVALKSFSGKIVLLDFWATWCVPCVESLPSLEKLHQEAAPKGLVMISIDEDEDPKKAADLWAKRKEPWPNLHANAETVKQFPDHGIPYFVLIDGSGNVVFSDVGLDEDRCRSPEAERGEGRQRRVGRDLTPHRGPQGARGVGGAHAGSLSARSVSMIRWGRVVMSPAPMLSTRSPARSCEPT